MPPVPPAPEPDPEPDSGGRAPRRARRLAVIARVAVVIIALAVGGYLFRQGEVSKHLSDPAAANPTRSALADSSGSARADASASVPSKKPATPTTPATQLPPISGAPAIVQAIDLGDLPPPAGYTRESFSAAQLGTMAGFTIASPPGWQSVPTGQKVTLEGPDGSYVEIDLTRHATSDMVAEAEYLKGARRADFPGYQRIYSPPGQPRKKLIQPVTIQQTLGALWEFDWVTPGNVQLREDVLLFDLDQQSYTIYAAGPAGQHDNEWNLGTLGTVSAILRTFTPVPS
jgi:hypothetical protein